MIVGRQREISLFNEVYSSKRANIVAIYGRRRIGKSFLVKEYVKLKKIPALFFEGLEDEVTDRQIEHFTTQLAEQIREPSLLQIKFKSWKPIFDKLTSLLKASDKKTLLLFDELQWMAAGQSRFVSLLKFYWDNHWKDCNVVLVLCGSVASFMVEKVVKSKALYGRIDTEINLRQLDPSEAIRFFRNKRSRVEILNYLLVFGGIPKYLENIDLKNSFSINLKKLCFSSNSYLFSEPDRIFYSQFREARTYKKLVTLLQNKPLSLEEIAAHLKISSSGGLKRYLTNLVLADFVEARDASLQDTKLSKVLYNSRDEFLNFYEVFIHPNKRVIESGRTQGLEVGGPAFDSWLGIAFERFCHRHAMYLAEKMGFHLKVKKYLSLSGKSKNGGFQFDLAYLRRDKVISLCEMKHTHEAVGVKIISEFERKLSRFPAPVGFSIEKILICTSSVTKALRDADYFHQILTLEDIFS